MKRVLIVDDSATMRRMLGFSLRQGGMDVLEAQHGQDALEKLRLDAVDLIITDLNMPVMDGIGLIEAIRAEPALSATPILMLTTEGMAEKKDMGRAAGANGWIVKPFDHRKLLAAVTQLLPG